MPELLVVVPRPMRVVMFRRVSILSAWISPLVILAISFHFQVFNEKLCPIALWSVGIDRQRRVVPVVARLAVLSSVAM